MANTELILRNVTLEPYRMHISGKEAKANAAGKRNFTIIWNMPDNEEFINKLIEDGWPVKVEPRRKDNPDDMVARLKVNINYRHSKPPKFQMIQKYPAFDKSGKQLFDTDENGNMVAINHVKKTMLDEELSKEIDEWDITDVKVLLNLGSYQNPMTGEWAQSVYLKEMQFTKINGAFDYDPDVLDVSDLHPELLDDIAECPFDMD